MDPIIAEHIWQLQMMFDKGKCKNCVLETDKEILNCDVYEDLLTDCPKWKNRIFSEQVHLERLILDRDMLSKIKWYRFKRFWKNNRDHFIVFSMQYLKNPNKTPSKGELIKIYDDLIETSKNISSNSKKE